MNALGINIFGGGFTLGVKRAGFKILAQLEECNAGAKTFDLNTQYFGDIYRPLRYEDWPLLELDHAHLIYANPPCAPWSSANVRTSANISARMSDPRLAMTARTMETAMSLRPEVFVCESVSEAFTRGLSYYDMWAQRWLALGYGVTYFLSDAILHGVPSERRRFHFIAHRRELALEEPNMRTFMPRTVRMAIGDLHDKFGHVPRHLPRRFDAEVHRLIGMCEPGGKLRANSNIFSFMARRLYWDSPALTIAGMHLVAHPERDRYITIREGLRLCSYPDDFLTAETSGHASSATQAVMPLVGEWLARVAQTSIDSSRAADRDVRVVDWRDMAKPYRQSAVLAGVREELI